MWPRYVIIITNSLEKEQIKVLGKYYCVAFLGQNHLQLIAKLVLILANQNAQIWEISFDKINLEIILPKDSALNDCTQKCHCFQFTNLVFVGCF